LHAALDAFRPEGDVLEIACGTGGWTEHLLRYASHVTAVDASSEMIRLARSRVDDDPRVEFVEADIFRWVPQAAHDVVFFANWLSHVPPTRFDDFWGLVGRSLAPNGRIFFVDELEDPWRHDALIAPEEFVVDVSVPIVSRSLRDGR